MLKEKELAARFTYHPPQGNQSDRYTRIREHGYDLAALIDKLCPESRDKSLALTKVEEAVMWANASIARHDDD
jgi:hypothetical protein